jgi:DMSO/TMAO reductase YedYZ molybdopterin-dependent catalytic subunit
VVDNFPVLDLGRRPRIGAAEWRLAVDGAVDAPQMLDWSAFMALSQVEVTVDIHCVTRWSRLDVDWRGVRLAEVLALAAPRADAGFLLLESADGYTTNLPMNDANLEDVLLAYSVDGAPLDTKHGGPVRALVPHRYFWKSAKWLTRISVLTEDRPGFWEARGYHNAADPHREERFRGQG